MKCSLAPSSPQGDYSCGWRVLVEASSDPSSAWFSTTPLRECLSSLLIPLCPQAGADSCGAWAARGEVCVPELFPDNAAGLDAQRDFSRVAPSEGKCWQSRQHPDGDIRATAQGCSGRQMDTSPSLAQPPGPGPPPTHKGPALLLVLGNTCYEIRGHGRMWYAFHRAGISVRSSSSKLLSCHRQDHHLLYF